MLSALLNKTFLSSYPQVTAVPLAAMRPWGVRVGCTRMRQVRGHARFVLQDSTVTRREALLCCIMIPTVLQVCKGQGYMFRSRLIWSGQGHLFRSRLLWWCQGCFDQVKVALIRSKSFVQIKVTSLMSRSFHLVKRLFCLDQLVLKGSKLSVCQPILQLYVLVIFACIKLQLHLC